MASRSLESQCRWRMLWDSWTVCSKWRKGLYPSTSHLEGGELIWKAAEGPGHGTGQLLSVGLRPGQD